MTPKLEADAFRIWRYAVQREWKCTYAEIESATGIDRDRINYIVKLKGWGGRMRRHNSFVPAHVSRIHRGQNFDTNAIPVDLLMR